MIFLSETTNRGVTIFSEIFHNGYNLHTLIFFGIFLVVFVLTNLSLYDFDLMSKYEIINCIFFPESSMKYKYDNLVVCCYFQFYMDNAFCAFCVF